MRALLLLLATATFSASPTGPGKYILSRPTTGAPVDLANIDTAFHAIDPLQVNANGKFSLKKSLAAAGTFGDATHVAQITVDTFGIIHNVTNVTISGGGGGGGGGTVTSVGLTAPSIFTVTGSPVVGMGNLGFSWNGVATDLVNADGSTTPSANFLTKSTKLTGFASGANSTILATDSMLSAFAKAQGQIDALPTRFQPLENQRLSTTNSPTFTGLLLTNSSWEQPIARTTGGATGAGWQIEDPAQKWSFQIRQDGLSGSTAHSWSIDDITANTLRVWGNATNTVFKTAVNVDGQISEGGTYLSAKYLGINANAVSASRWNSGITLSTTQDVAYTSPTFNGTSSVSAAATVVGLRGVAVPAPSFGNLRYTGFNMVWDNTTYLTDGGAASFSSLALPGLAQYAIPRVVDGSGTFGASALTDNGSEVDITRPAKLFGAGSDVAGSGIFTGVFDATNFKGGFLQRSAADNLDVWTGNSTASSWQRSARFGKDLTTTFYGPTSAPGFSAKGVGSATLFSGPYLAMLPTNTVSGGAAFQYRGAGIMELWVSGSDPGDDFENALSVDHTDVYARGALDVAGGTILHSVVQFPTIPNGSVLGIMDAYGTVGAFNLAGVLSGYLPLTGGTLTGDLHGPFGDFTGVDTRQLRMFPTSTPPGDYGDRMWVWDAYGNYNDNSATLRLQRAIGGGAISPPDLLVDWSGRFSFGSGARVTGAGSDSYSKNLLLGVGDVSSVYAGGGLQRSAADNLDVWVGNTAGTGANRVARFGKDLSTTLYGTMSGTNVSLTGSLATGGTIRQDAAGNGSMGNLWTNQVRFRRAGYADSTYYHTVVNNTNGDLLFQRYTPASQGTDLTIDVNGDLTIAHNVNMVSGWLNTHGVIYVNGAVQTAGTSIGGSSITANSTTTFDGVGFNASASFQFDSSVVTAGSLTASGMLSVTGKYKPHTFTCGAASCTLPHVDPGEEITILFNYSIVSLTTYATQAVDARDQNGVIVHTAQGSNFWQGPTHPFGFGSTYNVNAAHLVGVTTTIAQLIY